MTHIATIRNKFFRSLLFGCLFALLISPAFAATLAGVESFNAIYPVLTADQLLKQVAKGDELAQHELANRLALGQGGFPSNKSAAAMWYSRAAQRGIPGSASLDRLPNAPIRISRSVIQTASSPPVANITVDALSANDLTQTLDGSASSGEQSIIKYVWDVWSASDLQADAVIADMGAGQAQITFPDYGNWFITLIIMDSRGQINHTTQHYELIEPLDVPSAPLLGTPLANSGIHAGQTVAFNWMRTETATSYQLTILNSASTAFSAVNAYVSDDNCAAEFCSIDIEIDATVPTADTYRWQVAAINAGGSSPVSSKNFSVIATPTQRPVGATNMYPSAGSVLEIGENITFEWDNDELAETYDFYIYKGATASNTDSISGIPAHEICTASKCSLKYTLDIPVSSYNLWRVVARNSIGLQDNYYSQANFASVEPASIAPASFNLLAPVSGATMIQGTESLFTWQESAGASSYNVSVVGPVANGDASFTSTVSSANCVDGSCSFSSSFDIPEAESYSWSVTAINSWGEAVSGVFQFSVVTASAAPPAQPVLSLPTAGAEFITDASVQFSWEAVENATSYDFYVSDSINGALPLVSNLAAMDVCASSECSTEIILDLPVSSEHSWHVRAVRDDVVSDWADRSIEIISLISQAPVASFTMAGYDTKATGSVPLTIEFDASPSSDDILVESYMWDFGDGSDPVEADSSMQTHTYTTVGTYTVSLIVRDEDNSADEASAQISVMNPSSSPSDVEASRLLAQASFGPSAQSILQVQSMGIENWIDRQLTLKGPSHLEYVQTFTTGSNRAPRHDIWWEDVVEGEDQLRQRMAFALSQIFVVSDTGFTLSVSQYPITHYYDVLREHAFNNFRELLEEVTLSPVMGLYLSMLQNAKGDVDNLTRADENFAREILQLFTIGLHELNIDGTLKLNQAGEPIPTFTQDQIEAFARVFTGWNYADAGVWSRGPFTGPDMISQMLPFEEYHDISSKKLLDQIDPSGSRTEVIAPAGYTARQDLEFALDNIFNHPNVAPFFSKQLIKRLVTSNPSPDYIRRVATVFNDNGAGSKGDLAAVVRAVLLDREARLTQTIDGVVTAFMPDTMGYYGKLREPVLRLSHLWRAFNIRRGTDSGSFSNEFNTTSPPLYNIDSLTGQAVLRSPSVFNFFQPSYSPAGPIADANLDAPEFELFTESNELATTNRIGQQIQRFYSDDPQSSQQRWSYLDFSAQIAIADDVDALIEHLNVLLLSGNMSDGLADTLVEHLGSDSLSEDLSKRVRDAVTLIMASPDYLIQM